MRKLFAVLLLMTPVLCFARGKHAPLPDSVATAKTVYIVNQTDRQDVTDGAYEAFTKWGLRVASKPNQADIIATFTRPNRVLVNGTTRTNLIDMTISLPDSQDAAYQTRSSGNYLLFRGDTAAKDCVKDFQKRVGAQ